MIRYFDQPRDYLSLRKNVLVQLSRMCGKPKKNHKSTLPRDLQKASVVVHTITITWFGFV